MRKYNISANLVRTIEQLYDKATSAVQMNGSIGEWFRTTVGVRQGCLLSPALNIFLERIMSDALEEHDGKVSIGGRNITNLRFANDIDALAEEEQELEALVESLDKTCTRYKMKISVQKTKLITNSANGIQREVKVKGQKLGTVTSFKYLGAVVSDDGSKPEVLSRIAQATAALTKLTLVISKSKGPSETVRDIHTSTYQICSIEEKTGEILLFSTIFYNLILDFCVITRTRFFLRDKRLFEITEVEITRVDCIST